MKKVICELIRIRNFKGIENLEVPLQKITEISGDNEEGKTTIFDAFKWVLDGKNSADEAEFGIKNYKKKQLNRLDHEVTVYLKVDGVSVELKKIYKEVWTTPTNEVTPKLTSHSTSYFIDTVEKKTKKEYEEYINSIADKETFRLLTDIKYFSTKTENERRSILLSSCGEITELEVAGGDKDLIGMLERKGSKSISDYESVINSQIKKMEEQKVAFPTRIDEASRAIVTDVNFDLLKIERTGFEVQKQEIEKKVSDLVDAQNQANESVLELTNKKAELKLAAEKSYQEDTQSKSTALASLNVTLNDIKNEIVEKEGAISRQLKNITTRNEELEKHKAAKEKLLTIYHALKAEVMPPFDYSSAKCKFCGADFNQEKIEEAKENYENGCKKEMEEKINHTLSYGKLATSQITIIQNELDVLQSGQAILSESLKELISKKEELAKQIIVAEEREVIVSEKTKKLKEEYNAIVIPEAKKVDTAELNEKKKGFEDKIREIDQTLAKEATNEIQRKRILELKKEEEDLNNTLIETKWEKKLIMDFKNKQSSVIESRVNEKFIHTKFKMFDTLMNGETVPVCITTYKGVNYSDVNYAGKINCGLEIINFLSQEKEVTLPVFIDNTESVNTIIEPVGQMVWFRVNKEKLSITNIKMF